MRRVVNHLVVVSLVGVVMVAGILSPTAASASGAPHLYWSNYGHDGSGTTLGRATLTGTKINGKFHRWCLWTHRRGRDRRIYLLVEPRDRFSAVPAPRSDERT